MGESNSPVGELTSGASQLKSGGREVEAETATRQRTRATSMADHITTIQTTPPLPPLLLLTILLTPPAAPLAKRRPRLQHQGQVKIQEIQARTASRSPPPSASATGTTRLR